MHSVCMLRFFQEVKVKRQLATTAVAEMWVEHDVDLRYAEASCGMVWLLGLFGIVSASFLEMKVWQRG